MDIIVKTVARLITPFVILFGSYILLHGHLTPGGAFPGGVIIATGFALLVIAYTERDVEHRFTTHELIDIKSAASLILIVLILKFGYYMRAELLGTQTFLKLWSGGFTPFLNIGGGLVVAAAIIVIIYSIVNEPWEVEE